MKVQSKQISILEVVNILNEIEKKFPVDEWKIDEIEIWPILREKIAIYLFRNTMIYNNNNKIFKKIYKIYRIFQEFYIYFKVNIMDKKHSVKENKNFKILISSCNIDRTLELGDKSFYDINCDTFYDIFNNNYKINTLIFEQFFNNKQNLPRYSKSKIFNIIILKARILSKLTFFKVNFQLTKYNEFKDYVNELGIPLSLVSEKKVKTEIIFYKFLSEYLIKKIKKTNIKLVLMMCYYSAPNFALSLACNKLNIPCIDIQHGCAGSSFHFMYYSWLNIPINGYKLLPTGFWCWDKEDAESIKNWKYKGFSPKIIHGGRLIRKQWLYKTGVLYNYYNGKIRPYIENKDRSKKLILITLQPGIIYPEWFKNIILTEKKYFWIIREHFSSDFYQTDFMTNLIKKENILITKSKDYPLEFLLSIIDLHVTFSSSVIIDAEYFSKQSIMLDNKNCDRYKKYIEIGCLECANNAKEFSFKVNKLLKKKYVRVASNQDIYTNGIEQLLNLIKK